MAMSVVVPAVLVRCMDCGAEGHVRCDKLACNRCSKEFDGYPALLYGQARQLARERLNKHQAADCA